MSKIVFAAGITFWIFCSVGIVYAVAPPNLPTTPQGSATVMQVPTPEKQQKKDADKLTPRCKELTAKKVERACYGLSGKKHEKCAKDNEMVPVEHVVAQGGKPSKTEKCFVKKELKKEFQDCSEKCKGKGMAVFPSGGFVDEKKLKVYKCPNKKGGKTKDNRIIVCREDPSKEKSKEEQDETRKELLGKKDGKPKHREPRWEGMDPSRAAQLKPLYDKCVATAGPGEVCGIASMYSGGTGGADGKFYKLDKNKVAVSENSGLHNGGERIGKVTNMENGKSYDDFTVGDTIGTRGGGSKCNGYAQVSCSNAIIDIANGGNSYIGLSSRDGLTVVKITY